jgi:hypothetical protein
MKICIISDTHQGTGKNFSEKLRTFFSQFDHILHAGDITSLEFLSQLKDCAPVTAVCGNMDGYPLDEILMMTEVVELDGVRFGLFHGAGSPFDIQERIQQRFTARDKVEFIVFGHTHKPLIRQSGKVTLLNPGSLMDSSRSGKRTYMVFDTQEKTVEILEFK